MTDFPYQSMILAAGLGTRMRPLSDNIPKPMIKVAGKTMIDRALDNIEAEGIRKIIVNTSYKADLLENYLKQRKTSDIYFSREEEPLETGGSIVKALHNFGNDPFFCINGDVIWIDRKNSALRRLAESLTPEMDAVLLLHSVETVIGYEGKGDFFADDAGNIRRRKDGENAPYIYTGIQILRPSFFVDSPSGKFSLNILYDRAIAAKPSKIKATIYDGELLNVGDVKSLELAEKYLTLKSS